jgi:hypothetical protein
VSHRLHGTADHRPSEPTGRLLHDYGLSITLGSLFVMSWLIQTAAGWVAFVADQREHGQAAEAFGPDGYVWRWAEATFENWQSEFLQLLAFVVLTAILYHKGSHESKDADEETDLQLREIREQLARIERRLQG